MKICAAQVSPIKGDIEKNISNHKRLVDLAILGRADLVVFPELSLTGYEPKLCKELATHMGDHRLDVFQTISDAHTITICIGLPTVGSSGVQISMIIFQPKQPRQAYRKQHLHADELPYFSPGEQQVILTINDKKIAPAICYESLLPEHSATAVQQGAEVYVASVAKSVNGVAKAFKHYPAVAKRYGMPVLMSNCVGSCDDFVSVGNSSSWNKSGALVGTLDGPSKESWSMTWMPILLRHAALKGPDKLIKIVLGSCLHLTTNSSNLDRLK